MSDPTAPTGLTTGAAAPTGPTGLTTEQLLAEQAAYYRARAREYDATSYDEDPGSYARVRRIVDALGLTGRVLELACGTGVWTVELARHADVLATDASPEVLEVARERCARAVVEDPATPDHAASDPAVSDAAGGGRVRFAVADAFAPPPGPWDAVFFSAWLSHVPADRTADLWSALRERTGRVLFVDEHPSSDNEEWSGGEVATRTLTDGRTFRIVKSYVDPAAMTATLRGLGWAAEIRQDGPWVVGEAVPLGRDSDRDEDGEPTGVRG